MLFANGGAFFEELVDFMDRASASDPDDMCRQHAGRLLKSRIIGLLGSI